MRPVELSKLVQRLDDTCRRQLENAAGMAVSRTHSGPANFYSVFDTA